MLKVEKKKTRSRENPRNNPRKNPLRVWILVAALALFAAVGAAWLLRPEAAPMVPQKQETGGTLIEREIGDIASVTVTRRSGETWTVEQAEDGALYLEGTRDWIVDPLVGDRFLADLSHLEYAEVLTEDAAAYRDHLAEFGLSSPRVTAECRFRDGQQVTIRVGETLATEEALSYMTVEGDDRLFAVDAGLASDLDMEQAMLHPVTQPVILSALLDQITVEDGSEQVLLQWRLKGRVSDADAAQNWYITVPFEYPADEEIMKNLRTSAANLRVGLYYGAATEANLQATGLDVPQRRLTFHMAAGSTGAVTDAGVYDVTEWEERTVTLDIGAEAGESAEYLRFGDEIFVTNHLTLSAFLDTDSLDTAARYLVATPLDSLTELIIEKASQNTAFISDSLPDTETEQYIDRTVYALDREGEEPRCLKNGTEIPYAAFEAAYQRLLTVTVSGKLQEGTTPSEPHTKITFHTISGAIHTVELWPFDTFHDGVTLDGASLFYLIHDALTALP